jgi:DNA replication protein DnaC
MAGIRTRSDLPPSERPYVEPHYDCELCHDFEVITWHDEQHRPWSRRCSCAAKKDLWRREQQYISLCNLPTNTDHMTLETFQARDQDLKAVREAATDLAEEKGNVHWLVLTGGCDSGKTHAAIAVCRRWLKRGRPARYAFTSLLLDELRQGFSKQGDSSYESMFSFFCRVGLLVLDDLGVENPTAWVQEKLETIIDYRAVNGLPLIVTTNLPVNRLPMRIASRLQRVSGSKIIAITSPEFRTVKER